MVISIMHLPAISSPSVTLQNPLFLPPAAATKKRVSGKTGGFPARFARHTLRNLQRLLQFAGPGQEVLVALEAPGALQTEGQAI